MKKYIEISEEVLKRLENGESVEGRLWMEKNPRGINFSGWNRKAPKRYKERKIGDLDYGFLTKTEKHITRHEKFPLSLGMDGIQSAMNRDNKQSQGIVYDTFNINQ